MASPTTDPKLDPEFRRILEEMRNRYMRRPTSTTASLTLSAQHGAVNADATGGAITITVPKASEQIGRLYTVKKIDASANAVTLSRSGSDNIEGGTTYALTAQNDSVTIQSDAGTNWRVVAKVTAGGGGGEVNTGSNVNVTGVGVFNGKVGVDLQFRGVNNASGKLTATLNAANKVVDLDVVEQAVLDAVGATRGSILERGVGGWVIVTPGQNGLPLTSKGAGADPAYAILGENNAWSGHIGSVGLPIWYALGSNSNSSLTAGAVTANTLYGIPFVAPARPGPPTLDRLSFNVTTLLAGNGRAGIYTATSATNLYPNSLVVDGGSIATGTTGVKSATISTALTPGALYWAVFAADVAVTVRTHQAGTVSGILGFDSSLPNGGNRGISVAFTFAALPATFPASAALVTTGTTFPAIFGRYSA